MVNHSLIQFIEDYKNRNKEYTYNIFTVNVTQRYRDTFTLPTFGHRDDYQTITLDEEDLKYLYDKYYRDYQINCNQRAKEKSERKRKEIEELEEQLNKLKNEQ
jgi:hypothetical protein